MPYPARVIARPVRDLLYPERCVVCGRFGSPVCDGCAGVLSGMPPGSRCPNCSARWEGERNCPLCYAWDALDGAVAPYEMAGSARSIVHGLKYGFIENLAPFMAGRIAEAARDTPFDRAFAVPLHRSRLRKRGFNQAELLLDALAWPAFPNALARTRNTETQVGKTARDRLRNVAGAFAYAGPPLAGLTVALVDDVITTGATVNECAKVLKDHGARSVVAFAFARAGVKQASHEGPIHD